MLNLLNNLQSSNPSDFWNAFRKLQDLSIKSDHPIEPEEWVTYFTNQMGKLTSNNICTFEKTLIDYFDKHQNDVFNELNSSITNKEVLSAICSLKNK